MIKFSFHRILIMISLYFMISCGNTSSEEKHHEVDLETVDSISATAPDPDSTAIPDKLKGITMEQKELSDIFKSISDNEFTEREQDGLVERHQDSVNQPTIDAGGQKAPKIEIEKAEKIKAAYGDKK